MKGIKPERQKEFMEIVTSASEKYKNAKNSIKKSITRKKRKEKLEVLLGGRTRIKVDMNAFEIADLEQKFAIKCVGSDIPELAQHMMISLLIECERGIGSFTKWADSDFVKNESTNWVGTLSKIDTDKDGDATVHISLSNNIEIRSIDISSSSPMYEELGELEEGKKVVFNGYFKVHNESLTKGYFLHTINLTERGALIDPEFKFQISSITPIN